MVYRCSSYNSHLSSIRASGPVRTPGVADMVPWDIVAIPLDPTRPDEGRRDYLVSGIRHRINSDEGFVSVIETGGPPPSRGQ